MNRGTPRRTATSTRSTNPLPLVAMPAGAQDPVRAVSLGLALLKAARVETWHDLVAALRDGDRSTGGLDGIDLTAEDLALLDGHLGLLGLIRVAPGTRGGGFTVTVAVCDRCTQWLLSTGAVPRRCRLTLGCPWAMVKAVPAKHPKPSAATGPPDLGPVSIASSQW